MSERESWDNYFMNLAYEIAERSTCVRRKVGSIAIRDKRIIATGYNGAPPGIPHCTKETCLRTVMNIPSGEQQQLDLAVHAEQNLLVQAAKFGFSLNGCTVYCTTMPCFTCAKLLYSVGVSRIFYVESYPDQISENFLKQVPMKVAKLFEFKRHK